MADVLIILTQVIFPILLIAGVGFLFYRHFVPDIQTLSRLAFYVLNPCLIFSGLVESSIPARDLAHIVLFAFLTFASAAVVAALVARLASFDVPLASAFVMVNLGTNSGNYGLAINLFAFGEAGLQQAIVFFLTSALLISTVGVFIAARGRQSSKDALRNVLGVPMAYAAVAALLVRALDVTVPETVFRATQLAGRAAVPVMLLVLGMQLARTKVNLSWRPVSLAVFIKLAIAPLLALIWVSLLGISGLTRQVGIVQAGTPTAVTMVILANEFDANPQFVASVVFVSTLLSLVTMTVLLGWLT